MAKTVHASNSRETDVHSTVTDSQGYFDTHSLLKATLEGGMDPEEATYGTRGTIQTDLDAELSNEDSDSLLSSLDESVEDNSASEGHRELEADSEDSDSLLNQIDSPNKAEAIEGDIEYVSVKDEDGRSTKLKIDFSNKEGIKNVFRRLHKMRKFQSQYDLAQKSLTDIQSKYDELNSVYSKLDSAWQEGGVKAVVNLLGGNESAFEEAVKEHLSHQEYLKNLSPRERAELDFQEKERQYQMKLEQAQKRQQEFEQQMSEKEEQAALRSLESKLHPAFDRYRFAGKLGDPTVEHQFDSAVWDQVTKRLAEYPDNIELTQAIIDKEFRTVANNFRKIVNVQTEKQVQRTIENKKAETLKRVQVSAQKGLKSNTESRQFIDDMKSGNIQDAFKAMFSGKVKL